MSGDPTRAAGLAGWSPILLCVRRILGVSVLATVVLLAGCRSETTSSEDSLAVVSESDPGRVADAVADCSQGPPASAPLTAFHQSMPDGVVGTVYNESDDDLYVSIGWNFATACRVAAGTSTAFAGSDWARSVELFISRNIEPDPRSGTYVWLVDPMTWYPTGTVQGFRFLEPGSKVRERCEPDAGKERDFKEGDEQSYDDAALGALTITRLPDDGKAAREWAGTTSMAVNDWARIDVRIWRVGDCS